MTVQPGLVEQLLGGPSAVIALGGIDVAAAATGPLNIRRGRADIDSHPDAATCSLEVGAALLARLPEQGDTLTVRLSPQALAYLGLPAGHQASTRFTGQLTDVKLLPTSRTRRTAVAQLTAVGNRSRLGQVIIGDTPWPAELDGARATRILAAAQAAEPRIVPGPLDPGQFTVLARDVDRRDAQQLLDELAADTGGELVELRDGRLAWRDAAARTHLVSIVELSASNLLAPLTWLQKLAGTLTHLVLGYGPATPQATVSAADDVSAAVVGTFAVTLGSRLADAAQAATRAIDLVGRRSRPRWALDNAAVDVLRTLTPAQAAALLGCEFGDMLTLTGLPEVGPQRTARVFIEGMTERHDRDAFALNVEVSTYAASGPAPRWADVPVGPHLVRDPITRREVIDPNALTWANVDTTLAWLSAVSWDPGDAGNDRWIDQSARVTWATTDQVRTWAQAR